MGEVESTWLLNHRKNVTSQFGEDGIVEKIFSILPEVDRWCVEFGAWDGVFCSNTHNLIKNKGYKSVLIEASSKKIPALKATYKDNPGQVILNKFIECNSGPNSLDNLLKGTPIPVNFDLLSIDIDGDDYHVWESLKQYKPKVVIIEFNLTIPSDVEAIQPIGNGNDFGASLLSISKMAVAKGYELVSATDNNGIFVKSEYFPLFNIGNNDPAVMWGPFEKKYTTKVYQKYDSSLVISGNDKIFWYHVPLRIVPEAIQLLPKSIRFFPAAAPRWLRGIAKLYVYFFKSNLRYPLEEDPFSKEVSHLKYAKVVTGKPV